MEKIYKILLPVTILTSSIILGWFIYSGITEKQYSINAQQKKEYIGKRKIECYEILEKERQQFTNVIGAKYHEPSSNPYESSDYNDSCRVEYKDKTTGVIFFKSY